MSIIRKAFWHNSSAISSAILLLCSITTLPSFAQEKQVKQEKTNKTQKDKFKEAKYPGGMSAFSNDFMKHFKSFKDPNIKVQIIVNFIVDADGSMSKINIVKDPGYGTGPAAIEALLKMKKWKPATLNGEAVDSEFTLPIAIQGSEI